MNRRNPVEITLKIGDITVKLLIFEQRENFERNSKKSGSKLVLSSISLSIKFSRPHFLGGLCEPSRFELVYFFFVEKFLGVASLRIEILRSFLRKCGRE